MPSLQAYHPILTSTRSRRKQAYRNHMLSLKSCSQLAVWLGFKLKSLIPKPTLTIITLGSAAAWLVPWRARCSDEMKLQWLCGSQTWRKTFQFALEVPGCFLRLMSLIETSNSWTIILPLEWLLGNKVVHMQEKAQEPCRATRGLGFQERHILERQVSPPTQDTLQETICSSPNLFLPSYVTLIISMPENPLLIHCRPGPVK